MSELTKRFITETARELQEMQKIGVTVPTSTFNRLDNVSEMAEYSESITASECASLLIELAL